MEIPRQHQGFFLSVSSDMDSEIEDNKSKENNKC